MKLNEATYFPDAKELTRHGFVSHMEDFIGKLIGDNPLGADVDDYLKGFDIDAPKALKMLTTPTDELNPDSAVVVKTERIKNGGVDEDGKPMKDEFQVIYKVPKRNPELGIKGIDEKLRNLYIKTFENHEIKGTVLNEDGEGGAMGDGGAMEGMGGASTTFSTGNYTYDANALSKKKKSSGEQSEAKTDFPIMRRSIYNVTNESRKRVTMYITEEQLKKLREEVEMDTKFGNFGYDMPITMKKDDPTLDHDDMLTRKKNKPVGHKSLEEGDSGIHIKKKNKGKFTATKKRTGKSTEELTHSKNPLTRRRAQFALNAAKWNHKGK